MSVLPIRTKIRGPAPIGERTSHSVQQILTQLFLADPSQPDIIDETLDLFRANSLFRNFEIKGPADRTLIILILFISDCLAKLGNARTVPTQIEATKLLNTLSVDTFPIPGDANFPLNSHYASPSSRSEAGKLLPSFNSCEYSSVIRLSPSISDTSSSGTLGTTDREVVCRWDRQAQQMVDVIPEKTLHEQKFRDMKKYL